MLFLTHALLDAAGFRYAEIEDTWVVPVRLRPVVTVECDGDNIMDALLEVHAVLSDNGCTYSNFAINGRYVSIVGLAEAQIAAVA